jgi:hypothetical protein
MGTQVVEKFSPQGLRVPVPLWSGLLTGGCRNDLNMQDALRSSLAEEYQDDRCAHMKITLLHND